MSKPGRKVVVSVGDETLPHLDKVVVELRAAGMEVEDVLESLGTVTGSVDTDSVSALARVPGVLDVELERGYQLPPEGEAQ